MNIILNMLRRTHQDKVVQSYAESFYRALNATDHNVIRTGPEGKDFWGLKAQEWDLLIDRDWETCLG